MHHFRSTLRIALGLAATAAVLPIAPAGAAPSVSPISDFPHFGQLAFRGTTTVVTQIVGDSATMLVGPGTAVPFAAPNTQSLPAWGQPHLGTDAARKPVVVYPHCTSAAVDSCTLRQYEVLSHVDSAIPGTDAAGVGETEGVMDRGALVFTRWTAKDAPMPLAKGGYGETPTTLVYKAAGKPARVLTKQGGEQLALDRGRVLQVRNANPAYGACGRPRLELLRVDGKRKPVSLAEYGCGLNAQTILAPTFVGGWIMWGLRTVENDFIARVQGSQAGAKAGYAVVPDGYDVAVPSARSGARLLTGDFEYDPSQPDPSRSLANVIGLSFTAKRP